ncbi:MAG: hypothetical protein ACI4WR_01330 [Bulleidia sp.]
MAATRRTPSSGTRTRSTSSRKKNTYRVGAENGDSLDYRPGSSSYRSIHSSRSGYDFRSEADPDEYYYDETPKKRPASKRTVRHSRPSFLASSGMMVFLLILIIVYVIVAMRVWNLLR